jgi:hypothetical protein
MDRVLGVALGVATVCLIFSILASHIQELWASFIARRAASLEAAIGNMLSDTQLTKSFFDHPLIQSISFSPTRSSILRNKAPVAPRPSYIASDQFNKVLQSVLTAMHGLKSSDLPSLIQALPDSILKKRLTTLTLGLEQDASGCNAALEKWYDDTMQRIGGFYKRNTQVVLLFIGLSLAVSCNVNLLTIGGTLWSSGAARDQVNALAQLYGCKDGESCNLPDYKTVRNDVENKLSLLPLGYNRGGVAQYWSQAKNKPLRELLLDWAFNLCGWLLAAVAISLGAPFWFDLINKFINIRMVGQKPTTGEDRKLAGQKSP